MTDESIVTPEKTACRHPKGMERVEGATSPTGGMVVMCRVCGATQNLNPPAQETVKDPRPILMEG